MKFLGFVFFFTFAKLDDGLLKCVVQPLDELPGTLCRLLTGDTPISINFRNNIPRATPGTSASLSI